VRRRNAESNSPFQATVKSRPRLKGIASGHSKKGMLREVHIAPGSSAAGCMKQAMGLKPRTLLVSQDSLSCGPLPSLKSLEEWQRVRAQYWRSLYLDGRAFELEPEFDVIRNADALRDSESIVLWIGTGTAEQLLLAWMVQLLRALNIAPPRLRVIQFGREPTKGFEIVGLGMLNSGQLRAHPPEVTLTAEHIAEIDAAWRAVTATDPDALLALVNDNERSVLPFLRRSLKALVFRFPDLKTGLNCWEDALLRYARDKGPIAAKVIGYTMTHDMKYPDWVGDAYLFARLRGLADSRLPHPFLSLSGSAFTIRGSQVTLTDTGAKALEGEANFVELNGINDWIGGVHLESSKGKLWFRRDDTLVAGS
jgi:uncharacterized protein DUF1835